MSKLVLLRLMSCGAILAISIANVLGITSTDWQQAGAAGVGAIIVLGLKALHFV